MHCWQERPPEGALVMQGLLVPEEVSSQVHEEGNKAYRVKKTGLDRQEQPMLPAFNARLLEARPACKP
jgi:hypothetical protein